MLTPPSKTVDALLQEVERFQQHFIECHWFLANNTHRLAVLLREAETRGVLLTEAFSLADIAYWLQHIDWQSKFLGVVLNFAKEPGPKSLRPLIELYGRDRDRMRVEVEILAHQLELRLAKFAEPADALVRKAILKNQKRALAVHLHARSGYGGADLAGFFKVPRTTAYGWLSWFESLPEGLREGMLGFIDTQVPFMAARQVPAIVPKDDRDATPPSDPASPSSPQGAGRV